MKMNGPRRLLGGLLAACFLLAASQAQATPVTWFLVDWEFEEGSTASGSFVYDADLDSTTGIAITSEIGPTAFAFAGVDASNDFLAFVTGDPATTDLTGTFALIGDLAVAMTNAGGTIDLVVGNNINSSQLTCTGPNCSASVSPIYLVSGSITTVPEPSTALLVGSALGVLGRARRRTSR